MTTFYKSPSIDSPTDVNPTNSEGITEQILPCITTPRKFVFDLASQKDFDQRSTGGSSIETDRKSGGEQIHPADRAFALAARKAVCQKFESAARTNDNLKASMQFRVVSPDGKMRLVNQLLSPVSPMSQSNHQVAVVETDLSQFATTPLKVVHIINGVDEQLVSTLNVSGFQIESTICPFSDRQLQILRLLAEGNTTAEISEALFISSDTVRTHRQHILQRSSNSNMTATVVDCVRKGWI